uniref:AAA+ ATPase domain-containing protein n=1 Tax=viral metagenome TaxID=1070528 RepID=A0A6C0ASD5_9ZZZZ
MGIKKSYHNSISQTIMIIQELNQICQREQTANEIKAILSSFEQRYSDPTFKKGFYIYGSPGSGKTQFVVNLLKEMNYDVIKYDAGDVRNKSLIDTITSNNISNQNVLNMMTKTKKKIAIVMDEIDGMNNGDKGGITALIKIIRQKKTKKQRQETMTANPIICIGNYYIDKKIKELMKVCNTFELKTPTPQQMESLILNIIPTIKNDHIHVLLKFIQGDFRKLMFVYDMFSKNPELLTKKNLETIFHIKLYNEDSKKITQLLINEPFKIEQHNRVMNETDRTIVALLWHENIVDVLSNLPIEKTFPVYLRILDNMCFADYIDRITFQNQIWQFNEMSSLIKTFYNNKIYHSYFPENKNKFKPVEVRFTKVLTKYSTEYNNMIFIYNLCQELNLDKKDLISMFQELRIFCDGDFCNKIDKLNEVEKYFENYAINKLDIKRMYRYLDKNIKKDTTIDIDGDSDLGD